MNSFSIEIDTDAAVASLKELIKFPTVSADAPFDGSYNRCADWLEDQLKSIGFDAHILPESVSNKPIVIGMYAGSDPSLPCIVLNSHYDVVPVMLEHWNYPAFEGFEEQDRIYGRGTQDMKCVCAQYLVALKHLLQAGYQPKRTIYVTYVPDEEIGGGDGMGILIESAWFKGLNIELALDEGLASVDDSFSIFYGERLPWWVHIKATGNTGHGSRFIEGTAVEQVIGVVNKALEYRQEQLDRLHGRGHHAGCNHAVASKRSLTLGDVTSINVTMLRAGVQASGKDIINVVPAVAEAGFDVRISPHVDPMEVSNQITGWCQEVQSKTSGLSKDQGVTWDFFYEPLKQHSTTSTDENENHWYKLIKDTLWNEFQAEIVPQVFPAATDSRFLRHLGLKAFGFSPMRRSPILLHEHNEYIDKAVYLEGCRVYVALIKALTSS